MRTVIRHGNHYASMINSRSIDDQVATHAWRSLLTRVPGSPRGVFDRSVVRPAICTSEWPAPRNRVGGFAEQGLQNVWRHSRRRSVFAEWSNGGLGSQARCHSPRRNRMRLMRSAKTSADCCFGPRGGFGGSMPLDRKRFFVALTIEHHWPGEFRPLSPLG
jgi:hypothetical protein